MGDFCFLFSFFRFTHQDVAGQSDENVGIYEGHFDREGYEASEFTTGIKKLHQLGSSLTCFQMSSCVP